MKILRTDVISLLDLRFDKIREGSPLFSPESKRGGSSPILARLEESFTWLFYGEQLSDFDLYDISDRVPGAAGAVLRINRRLGIGTYILWHTYRGDSDPHALKSAAWARSGEDLEPVRRIFQEVDEERFYPFVAMEVDTDDIDRFAVDHAEEIGRILTGDLEGERPSTLRKYIDTDLSLRSYEKLLVRWTEALALYSRMDSEKKYEECMFRAVQVFEHCILARVSILAMAGQMERFTRRLTIMTWPKWLKSRDLLTSFSNIEEAFVMYPRVQSVEADRLISGAHAQFGIDKVLAAAKAKQTELREQLEWAKAQTLGLLALITYLLDKIVGWDNVRHWIVGAFHGTINMLHG